MLNIIAHIVLQYIVLQFSVIEGLATESARRHWDHLANGALTDLVGSGRTVDKLVDNLQGRVIKIGRFGDRSLDSTSNGKAGRDVGTEVIKTTTPPVPVSRVMVAGACAGFCSEVATFPIDTLRSRLQATAVSRQPGQFRGIYRGVSAAVLGSGPGAAVFFGTYEAALREATHLTGGACAQINQGAAACIGKLSALVVRTPMELLKQRIQTGIFRNLKEAGSTIMTTSGLRGFYTGYGATVSRELPFALVTYPLRDHLKKELEKYQGSSLSVLQAGACGSAAAIIGAFATTPHDVAKTRIMLGQSKVGTLRTMKQICLDGGLRGLFAGAIPRAAGTGAGGFIYFLAYDAALELLRNATF